MSLVLDRGTKPDGLQAKTFGVDDEVVFLGDYKITMEDFLVLAHYVLTNSNLTEDDPRLQFVESVRGMAVVKDYPVTIGGKELDTKRLHTDVPPVLDK